MWSGCAGLNEIRGRMRQRRVEFTANMLDRLLTCAIAAALLLLAGCGKGEASKEKAAAAPDLETRVVRVVTAAEKDTDRLLFAYGILAA